MEVISIQESQPPRWWPATQSAIGPFSVVLAVLLIVGATLWPQPGNETFEQSSPACPLCWDVSVADIVANVLLFFPFGFFVALWRKSGRAFPSVVTQIALLALVLSTSIEVIQYFGIVNGRHASVFDVACNVTGAALGGLIAGALPWVARASVEASRWLFALWCVGIHVLLLAFGWALQRPRDAMTEEAATRSSLEAPTGFGWFAASVVEAEVDGIRFAQRGTGPVLVTSPVRAEERLRVDVIGRDERRGFVPLLFVHERNDVDFHAAIGQFGDDYGLRVRVNASRIGVQMPALVLGGDPGGIEAVAHSGKVEAMLVRLNAFVSTKQWMLTSTQIGEASIEDNVAFRVRPVSGWMLFFPVRSTNGTMAIAGTAAFAVLLFLPLCFLGVNAFRDVFRGAFWAGAAAVSALVLPAVMASLSMPSAMDVLSVLVALAGSALSRRFMRNVE